MKSTVFLFGEAEKGEFCTPQRLTSVAQLAEEYGNPPVDSVGIIYGIQALMYERDLIFFRVKEEGFSVSEYMRGIRLLDGEKRIENLAAICVPGVGDAEIIAASARVSKLYKSFLIITEKDLHDYLH